MRQPRWTSAKDNNLSVHPVQSHPSTPGRPHLPVGKCSFEQLPLDGVEAALAAWESVLPKSTQRPGLCGGYAIL